MMLKRTFAIFLCFLFPILSSAAQSTNGLVYEIRKDNEPVGYLIGLMHTSPNQQNVVVSRTVFNAISRSNGLITELGLQQFVLGEPVAQAALEKARGRKHLADILPPEEFNSLVSSLKPIFGVNTAALINDSHPWSVGNALFRLCQISLNPVRSEASLVLAASNNEKPTLALETIEEQVSTLPDYEWPYWKNYLATIAGLVSRPDCPKVYGDILQQLSTSISEGNLTHLKEAMDENYKLLDIRKFDEIAIQGRNAKMLHRMIERLNFGKTFVFAIGAFHLVGEMGILEGLKQQGFEVVQIH